MYLTWDVTKLDIRVEKDECAESGRMLLRVFVPCVYHTKYYFTAPFSMPQMKTSFLNRGKGQEKKFIIFSLIT